MESVWTGKLPRISEDVFWEYVEKGDQEAVEEAILAYFDRTTVAKILVELIDPDDLDEFLEANFTPEEFSFQPRTDSMEDFLQELDQFTADQDGRQEGRVDWRHGGF
jgi:hypothetical protein